MTMKHTVLLIGALLSVLPASARNEVTDTSSIERSIELSSASRPGRLIVDNVFGAITITGYGGRTIEVTARETFEARDQAALERARREVSLEIRERDNTVELYVNGPFRDERDRHRGHRWDQYITIYDFEIKVPRETQLELKTVNRGKIRVTDVRGDFDVRNVNDDIELRGVAGSGRVATVNGPVRVWFAENPREETSFKTINGDVEIHFQDGLSADLSMKTMNGEFWSAFEVEPLPRAAEVTEKNDNGMRVIHSKSRTYVRAGRGGPRLTFETLNGDVLLRRNDR